MNGTSSASVMRALCCVLSVGAADNPDADKFRLPANHQIELRPAARASASGSSFAVWPAVLRADAVVFFVNFAAKFGCAPADQAADHRHGAEASSTWTTGCL
jgi:hypothetical protein